MSSPVFRASTRALALGLTIFGATSCREAAQAFGPTPASARQNADEFLYAYAARFANVTRTPKLTYVRHNIGRGALIPSRLFPDTAVWTARLGDTARVTAYSGTISAGRYLFSERNPTPPLEKPGDSYHLTRLRRLSRDEYEWNTAVDFLVGNMSPATMPAVVAAALKAAEHRGASGVRSEYRSQFARTTAALGRLYSLDTLRVTPDSEGASTIALTISASPQRLRATHPALADYLKKYLERTDMRLTISDSRGARWLEMTLRNQRLDLRLRSRDGQLAPLEGPVRTLPTSLVVRTDFTTRILLFNVGWRNLVTDMTIVRDPDDHAWQLRSRREPDWVLPPLAERFIRTPLRRPFTGAGASFRLGFRAQPTGTHLYRRGSVQVEESGILRFLGRLSGQAMSDFYGRSEMDENSFNGDVFTALRADLREVLSRME